MNDEPTAGELNDALSYWQRIAEARLDRALKAEARYDRTQRFLDDAVLRGYLPEMAGHLHKELPTTDAYLAAIETDVLLDNLERIFEQAPPGPDPNMWRWFWELVARGLRAAEERDQLRAVVENIRAYTAPLPGNDISRVWTVVNDLLEHGEVSQLDVSEHQP